MAVARACRGERERATSRRREASGGENAPWPCAWPVWCDVTRGDRLCKARARGAPVADGATERNALGGGGVAWHCLVWSLPGLVLPIARLQIFLSHLFFSRAFFFSRNNLLSLSACLSLED